MIRLFLVIFIGLFPAATSFQTDIAAAVSNSARPVIDIKNDGGRKPAEVLSFFGTVE